MIGHFISLNTLRETSRKLNSRDIIKPMDEIDKILNEIQQEYSKPNPKGANSSFKTPQNRSVGNSIDRILGELQADFQEKDLAEELAVKQEAEQERVKQAEVFQKQAEDWLKKLDPLSSEGLWFERFAEQYPSKLAAAIDYLASN
jgi:hypothetical protein